MKEIEIKNLFKGSIQVKDNVIELIGNDNQLDINQKQTEEIFSDKWIEADEYDNINKLYEFQYDWFLSLYGFDN